MNETTDTQRVWRKLLEAFSYQHATLSEAELLAKGSAMSAGDVDLTQVFEWAKNEQLLEVADEAGRLRLTPQGRRVWRDTLGHA